MCCIKERGCQKRKKLIEKEFLSEIQLKKIDPLNSKKLGNIAVVGDKMKDHQGISGRCSVL